MPPDPFAAHDAAVAGRILTAWAVQQVTAAQPDPPTLLAAAAVLRELASAGRESITEVATAGGIPALAGLLSSDNASDASKAAALVALRRLASQTALFDEVAGAASIPACLQLLGGEHGGPALYAAAAALLTSLAAGSEQCQQQAITHGAAALLLRHVMNGSMHGGVWQPRNPLPHALEFAAARALHTLHPGAPDTGLCHAGLWQTVSALDRDAGDVQQRAVEAICQLARQHLPTYHNSPEHVRRQLADHDLARSVKLLLLVRAGAIPRLVSLVETCPTHYLHYATGALSACAEAPSSIAARVAAELVAAGAVPALLQAAGISAGGILGTSAGKRALQALVFLAVRSKLDAQLVAQLMPAMVRQLQAIQDGSESRALIAKILMLVQFSAAARRAALQAGAVPALRDRLGHPTCSVLAHAALRLIEAQQ